MDAALRNNGNGVYMQRVDLPSDQGNTTAYLVCRNGVTNEQAGKITPNPLRLRFWVTYQAGESEPMMLDVLTFQGNKDYQVFSESGKISLIVSLRQMKVKRWQEKEEACWKAGQMTNKES